jgi:porin
MRSPVRYACRAGSPSVALAVLLALLVARPAEAQADQPLRTDTAPADAPLTTAAEPLNVPPSAAQPALDSGAPATSQSPVISDATNPAAMDSVIQVPLLANLPLRRTLYAQGIDFTAHYISESAANTAGVHGTGAAYAQQIDFGASFDLGKLGLLPDTFFRFAMTDRSGRSLAADKTGSYFAYQEIYGQGQNLRFNEITLEHFWLDKAVAVKVGFYPMGNDFGTLPYVCNFQNVAFCGHPQSMPVDSGWSDAPAGRWGGRIKWRVTDAVQLQAGVYDVNPLVTLPQNGFKLDLRGSTGAIIPVEFTYQRGTRPEDYAGTYKIGVYYDTSRAPDLSDASTQESGRYGVYIEAAQQIFKPQANRHNGLAVFAIVTANDQATAKFVHYYEAGLAYRGLAPGRDLDLLSLGLVRTDINRRLQTQEALSGLPVQTHEQLIELNYTIQVLPSLSLRPGIQYDDRPGGLETRPNTWVFAFQAKLTL